VLHNLGTVIISSSRFDYDETVERLLEALHRHQLTVFARIDHAAAAREVGLELADEQVVVFGNPRAGTGLMRSDPSVGVELPLRMLVWDGGEGIQVGYNDPLELTERYAIGDLRSTLEAMSGLLAELAAQTVS
jgi:uncharacterized protein (DUF302 family)